MKSLPISNPRVAEFVSSRHQVRVLDPNRKWLSSIRELFQATGIAVEVVLDLAELCDPNADSKPAVAVVHIESKGILSAAAKIGRLATIARLPFIALLDSPDDELASLLRQSGFSAVICGLNNVDRVRKLALRYFSRIPDPEMPLELAVERNLPWKPAP
jgi:AmiR/NasT family two-component response regulator